MRLPRSLPMISLAVSPWLQACSTKSTDAPDASPPAPTSYQPLVTLDGWSGVAREDDPFVTDPALAPACVGDGFRIERTDNWLEVDTGVCNWVTLSGGALHDVAVGQMLELDFSHYDLNAAAPALAQLRLTLEGCDAWSKVIRIPTAAAVYMEQFASPCALKETASVLFHLNNHGQNNYQLRSLSVLR